MASESSRDSRLMCPLEDIRLEHTILGSDGSLGAPSFPNGKSSAHLQNIARKQMQQAAASAVKKAARSQPSLGRCLDSVCTRASAETPPDEIGSCGERGSEGGGVEGGTGGPAGGSGGNGGSGGTQGGRGGNEGIGGWGEGGADGGGELGTGVDGGDGGDGGADGGRGGDGGGGDGAGMTLTVHTRDCDTVATTP
eukprot:CAMPEP_0205867060 /NCGR_PEP_ID=MMETSP1083-20121108/8745_1 /ASSEMBLY_ACC=CAM_ASM_000430 /TAXON_ID=97485 /ORGANISM="Prymnesium parvum, Strain Texoma1" /LENGTH=194 /DNA_ID=CAMNT_0053229093 /DNA_START=766 /DNA_END=1350 /DNA_ORIENTATION=-